MSLLPDNTGVSGNASTNQVSKPYKSSAANQMQSSFYGQLGAGGAGTGGDLSQRGFGD